MSRYADKPRTLALPGDHFMIGNWQVSVSACTLRDCSTAADNFSTQNGSAGNAAAQREVKITPRSMDVLTWLAGHADQVISTQQLLSAI